MANLPGLTSEEVNVRRQAYGSNTIPESDPATWRRLLTKLWAPVPWMLEAAIVLQFMLREYLEAAVIALLLLFNAALGLLQEGRAQATLKALKSRLAVLAAVRRDGVWQILPTGDIVPDDVVKLTLGSIVPADVVLLDGDVLLDQSMLTGESLPVEAAAGAHTYAGALVRRGEALAQVVATGVRTKFGRTAELVSAAHAVSSQQQAVLRVVRNLAIFSGVMVTVQVLYATFTGMPGAEMIPLALPAVLAAIPVALPATFTLAAALAARALVARHVLPTRLSAIDEAATIDVLCADKTGTLTQNELAVTAVQPAAGWDAAPVVDPAVRAPAARAGGPGPYTRVSFVPFDPSRRTAEAQVVDAAGRAIRVIKGALASIAQLTTPDATLAAAAAAYAAQGYRVLAVAAGPADALQCAGVLALSDPPRPDARELIAQLRALGVQTVMVTGDAPATATVVARQVGLEGAVCPVGK